MKNYKNILILVLVFILSFGFNSCDKDDENQPVPFSQNITFSQIGYGYMSSYTNLQQQNTIITNQTQWTNLINQMNSNGNVSDTFTTTNIDFTNYILIAVIDIENRPNNSYRISINSITEYDNNIIVDVSTSGSINGFAELVQPYHIVKIPIQSKPFVFQ